MFSAFSVQTSAFLCLALATASLAQDKMKLGAVLVVTAVDSKPAAATGDGMHLFTADRGSRKGQHIVVTTSPPTTSSTGNAAIVYRLVGPATVGSLPDVEVLGMHYVKVRLERRDAFERFVAEKIHPTVGNLRPDLRVLYYKATTGPDAGNYVALFALTKASRDKYWPGGSDSDELRAAFTPAVRALTNELRTYLVEGSYLADEKFAAAVFESREWTDFVLVPTSRR